MTQSASAESLTEIVTVTKWGHRKLIADIVQEYPLKALYPCSKAKKKWFIGDSSPSLLDIPQK